MNVLIWKYTVCSNNKSASSIVESPVFQKNNLNNDVQCLFVGSTLVSTMGYTDTTRTRCWTLKAGAFYGLLLPSSH